MYFHSGKLHYESVTFGWRASGQKKTPKQMSTQQQTFASHSCDRPPSRCTPLFPGKRATLAFEHVSNYHRRSETVARCSEVALRHRFGCTNVTWRPVASAAAAALEKPPCWTIISVATMSGSKATEPPKPLKRC